MMLDEKADDKYARAVEQKGSGQGEDIETIARLRAGPRERGDVGGKYCNSRPVCVSTKNIVQTTPISTSCTDVQKKVPHPAMQLVS